jgi:aerobic C4-dicarboxylate transport protein
MTLILGVDKFMSECRAITNLIGNGVATVVVSRWEGELDREKLRQVMEHPVSIGTDISDHAPNMDPATTPSAAAAPIPAHAR